MVYNAIERNRRKTQENRIFVLNYKKDKCCFICSWNEHTEILQFHHVNPKDKSRMINYLVNHSSSLKTLREEIDKCILLCPNCHLWHTYKEQSKEVNNGSAE